MKKKPVKAKRKQSKYYSNGNLAYNTTTAPQIEPEERKRIRRKTKTKQTQKIKISGAVNSAKLVIFIGIVFMGCIITMESYAKVQEKIIHINNMADELNKIKSENSSLEAEIAGNLDISYIEQEAKTRLGMSEPQPYQIIYVNVPKQSYTVQQDMSKENKKGFSFKDILDLFKKD